MTQRTKFLWSSISSKIFKQGAKKDLINLAEALKNGKILKIDPFLTELIEIKSSASSVSLAIEILRRKENIAREGYQKCGKGAFRFEFHLNEQDRIILNHGYIPLTDVMDKRFFKHRSLIDKVLDYLLIEAINVSSPDQEVVMLVSDRTKNSYSTSMYWFFYRFQST